ncbi:MAG: monofunctional biosynthetic peptidoglycan transglycosylase [Bacteroidota bacterium]
MSKGKKIKTVFKIVLWPFVFFIIFSIVPVVLYKFMHPPVTPLMFLRSMNDSTRSDTANLNYKWVSIDEMSPYLFQAALAAEDDRFLEHNGFDFRAMKLAYQSNQKTEKTVKGGSTISQQTAKNVFLWPHRDYLRKSMEAWFTVLIEFVWGKKKILETYLNVVEFGNGVYGVEAASLKYYKKHASKLTQYEAASLIAVLPNPHIYKVLNPSNYTMQYRNAIVYRMAYLPKVEFK